MRDAAAARTACPGRVCFGMLQCSPTTISVPRQGVPGLVNGKTLTAFLGRSFRSEQGRLNRVLEGALCSTSRPDGLQEYRRFLGDVRSQKRIAFGTPALNASEDKKLLAFAHALTHSATCMHGKQHQELLQEILDIPLWACGPDLRAVFLQFSTRLIVTDSGDRNEVLRSLVAALRVPSQPEDETALEGPWHIPPAVAEVQDQILEELLRVLALAPSTCARTVQLLGTYLPHKLSARAELCTYYRGVLALIEHGLAGALHADLLATLVEHLLSLDVDIRWQDIAPSSAGETCDLDEEDMFELEEQANNLSLMQAGADRGDTTAGLATAYRHGGVNLHQPEAKDEASAEKLDALMDLMFAHLAKSCNGDVMPLWRILLRAMSRILLRTQRSKFTQYLLWYVCNRAPAECGHSFAHLLFQCLVDPSFGEVRRSAAAAYLASFIARNARLPPHLVVRCMLKLGRFCADYCAADSAAKDARRTSKASSTAMPETSSTSQHQAFYAACQGLMYICCYRLEALMTSELEGSPSTLNIPADDTACQPSKELAKGVHAATVRRMFASLLPGVLQHRLAPLDACLPSITTEFLRLARRLRLMECKGLQPVLYRRKRPLEMFFPFDPYLLRRSSAWLDLGRTYLRWRGGQPHAVDELEDADNADLLVPEGLEADEADLEGAKELEASDSSDGESDVGSLESEPGTSMSDGSSLRSASPSTSERGYPFAGLPSLYPGTTWLPMPVPFGGLVPGGSGAKAISVARHNMSNVHVPLDPDLAFKRMGAPFGASPGAYSGGSGPMSWTQDPVHEFFQCR